LAGIRDGVCYVGITFKKTSEDEGSTSACCAAQLFLQDGDGVVFRGDEGRWYSPEDKMFHLSREAARKLLAGVLDAYRSLYGRPLREVFIHSHSEISDEEYRGYVEACESGVQVVAVRVRQHRFGTKLFRQGKYPVLRGTTTFLSNKSSLLWSNGFKPRLGVYDGVETPVPLKIDIQHGDADIETVTRDIFALTKLNYNACRFGSGFPITIGFAGALGEILVSNPTVAPKPQIRFYI
jgi:hypothetical protein